uniref:Uncharacterized protein n=1 Tax=Arundo donax TaxID=35708 RepID=A0A0A8Z681_ARUDO
MKAWGKLPTVTIIIVMSTMVPVPTTAPAAAALIVIVIVAVAATTATAAAATASLVDGFLGQVFKVRGRFGVRRLVLDRLAIIVKFWRRAARLFQSCNGDVVRG